MTSKKKTKKNSIYYFILFLQRFFTIFVCQYIYPIRTVFIVAILPTVIAANLAYKPYILFIKYLTTNFTMFSLLAFRCLWLSINKIIDIDGRNFSFSGLSCLSLNYLLCFVLDLFFLSPLASFLFRFLAPVFFFLLLFALSLFHASSQIPFGVSRCLSLLLANF